MKAKFYIVLIGLLLGATVHGQVKIGDNPQNIHPSSVLELESTTRALVVTRITTAQMTAMVPLQGAVVYNTDNQCLHYYSGTAWINLCEALEDGKTFSANAVTNPIPTIIITETGNNVNFEVGQITGDNIVDGSINGAEDIQFGSVTQDNLALNSVGRDQLVDNAITPAEIDLALVTLNTFNNDAGFITGAGIVSTTAGNVITNDNGAYYSDALLQSTIATNSTDIATNTANIATNTANIATNTSDIATNTAGLAAHIAADGDLDDTNEIQTLAEVLTEGNAANNSITNLTNPTNPQDAATKFYVDNALTGPGIDNQQLTLEAGNLLTLENGGTPINLTPFLTPVVPGAVVGTPNSIFFADTDGTPITAEDTGLPLHERAFFWNRTSRSESGALFIGLKELSPGTVNANSVNAKVVIAEELNGRLAYPLKIVNEGNSVGTMAGILFSTEATGTQGKGALVYERTGANGIGAFHFLQNTQNNGNNPTLPNAVMTVKNDGNVTIGANSRAITATQKFHVEGDMRLTGNFFDSAGNPGAADEILSSNGTGTVWIPIPNVGGADGDTDDENELQVITSSDESILVSTNGIDFDLTIANGEVLDAMQVAGVNVGIGIIPTERLHVDGNILAPGSITPDYVFQSYFDGISALKAEYKMMSLKEIEAFAKTNKHLPGVPSAKEVAEKGGIIINRATEINLEKIEELFLHTINQEKEIEKLKSSNQTLSTEIEALKKDLAEIKKALSKE